jgi:hypothetical protein
MTLGRQAAVGDARTEETRTTLHELAELREHRFTSRVPLIGGLIAALRTVWNNISTRWYVAPVLRQQSDFNRLAADELVRLQEWLISQDREQAQLRHDLGELALLVGQLRRERETGARPVAARPVAAPQPDHPGPTETSDRAGRQPRA